MSGLAQTPRYTTVAIVLHWLIAFAILGMIGLGWYMGDVEDRATRVALVQLHKSIGITILLLTLTRVLWRLMNPPPPEPAMPVFQKFAASMVHMGFYGLMILMPLTGWIMVSASKKGTPTILFDTLKWPHLPFLPDMADQTKAALHDPLENLHSKLAWVAIGLLVLHVAGALKHQFVDKDGLMARMIPGVFGRTDGPIAKGRGGIVAFGAAFAALALGVVVSSSNPAPASAADPQPAGTVSQSNAPAWAVDPATSSIRFAWNYAGTAGEGSFSKWTANIQLDPAAPETARIRVAIPVSGISTGDSYYDGTLQEPDWFNGAAQSEMLFEVNEDGGVMSTGPNSFEATGLLKLRGETFPLRLPFTLDVAGDKATAKSEFTLQRTALKIGSGTPVDAAGGADWVADAVKVTLEINATRR